MHTHDLTTRDICDFTAAVAEVLHNPSLDILRFGSGHISTAPTELRHIYAEIYPNSTVLVTLENIKLRHRASFSRPRSLNNVGAMMDAARIAADLIDTYLTATPESPTA